MLVSSAQAGIAHGHRSLRILSGATLAVVLLALLLVSWLVVSVETSVGPVHIGAYSVTGPKTTITGFPGLAWPVLTVGPYTVFRRSEPRDTPEP